MHNGVAPKLAILWPRMVEHALIGLMIEFEIMFESFVHNFARVHIFRNEHVKRCYKTYVFYSLEWEN